MKTTEKKAAMKTAMSKKASSSEAEEFADWYDDVYEKYIKGGPMGSDGDPHYKKILESIDEVVGDAPWDTTDEMFDSLDEGKKEKLRVLMKSASKTAAIYADDVKVMMGEWSENEWGGLDNNTLSVVEDFIDYLREREVLQ